MSRMAPPIPLARHRERSADPADTSLSTSRAPSGRFDDRRSSSDVESIINDITHDAARDTLLAWREHLINENASKADPQSVADARILRALKAWQNPSGEFEWERSRRPADRMACEQDRVTKLISAGLIPTEIVQNPDPEMLKLNKYNYEKQVIGSPLLAIKEERNQRYEAAQQRWKAEQEQKQFEIQQGYLTGAFSERERAMVRRGLRFAAENAPDEASRERARKILEEDDRPVREAMAARGPQSVYIEKPEVAQRLAQNPANVEAARRLSPQVYNAMKQAAPRQMEDNAMPEPEQIEKARTEAEKRLLASQEKLEKIAKAREELTEKRTAPSTSQEQYADQMKRYQEAERLLRFSMRQDQELLSTIQSLEDGGNTASNSRNHAHIRKFNELSRDRVALNRMGRAALSALKESTA